MRFEVDHNRHRISFDIFASAFFHCNTHCFHKKEVLSVILFINNCIF